MVVVVDGGDGALGEDGGQGRARRECYEEKYVKTGRHDLTGVESAG